VGSASGAALSGPLVAAGGLRAGFLLAPVAAAAGWAAMFAVARR
jgi:hypothetical protein